MSLPCISRGRLVLPPRCQHRGRARTGTQTHSREPCALLADRWNEARKIVKRIHRKEDEGVKTQEAVQRLGVLQCTRRSNTHSLTPMRLSWIARWVCGCLRYTAGHLSGSSPPHTAGVQYWKSRGLKVSRGHIWQQKSCWLCRSQNIYAHIK